ncbi:unnamed protein product [Calypogeia fissa]
MRHKMLEADDPVENRVTTGSLSRPKTCSNGLERQIPKNNSKGSTEDGKELEREEQNVNDRDALEENGSMSPSVNDVNVDNPILRHHNALRQGMDELLNRSSLLWEENLSSKKEVEFWKHEWRQASERLTENLSLQNEVEFWKNNWRQTLELQTKINSLENEVEKWKAESRQASNLLEENISLRTQVEQSKSETSNLLEENISLRNQVEQSKSGTSNLLEETVSFRNQVEQSKSETSNLLDNISLRNQVEQLKSKTSSLQEESSSLRDQVEHSKCTTSILRRENLSLREQVEHSKSETSSFQEETIILRNQVEHLKSETSSLRDAKIILKDQLEQSKRETSSLREENISLQKGVEQSKNESRMAEQARNELEAKVATLLTTAGTTPRKRKRAANISPDIVHEEAKRARIEAEKQRKSQEKELRRKEKEKRWKEKELQKEKQNLEKERKRKEKELCRKEEDKQKRALDPEQRNAIECLVAKRKMRKENSKQKVESKTGRKLETKKQSSGQDDDEELDADDPKAHEPGSKGEPPRGRFPSAQDTVTSHKDDSIEDSCLENVKAAKQTLPNVVTVKSEEGGENEAGWQQSENGIKVKSSADNNPGIRGICVPDENGENPDSAPKKDSNVEMLEGSKDTTPGSRLRDSPSSMDKTEPEKKSLPEVSPKSPKVPFRSQSKNNVHGQIPQQRDCSPTPSLSSEQDDDDLIRVPDAEFYDFDALRTGNDIVPGQVWAIYDDHDGMPRFYVRISKVTTKPFKAHVNWLHCYPATEKEKVWTEMTDLDITCGDFKIGKPVIMDQINTFSHFVVDKVGRGPLKIYPRKGEVWAVYKDPLQFIGPSGKPRVHEEWSPPKCEMVEILSDFCNKDGLRTGKLVKVRGFKTVFHRGDETESFSSIKPEQLVRFSHGVPNQRIEDSVTDEKGIPRGSLELDPAAIPADLMMDIDSTP